MSVSNFKNFFPTIVGTLGFSRNVTLALTCPPYLVAGVLSIAWAASSGRFNERVWHITVSKAIAVMGFVLACSTLNTGARYFAMCAFASGKAISLAIVNTVATLGPICTPYLWPASDAPRYTTAMASSAAFSIGAAILAWVLRAMLKRANRELHQSSPETTTFFAY
ncbi:hypothetical protein CC79DRAFT_1373052 [Sarocladium strictum]